MTSEAQIDNLTHLLVEYNWKDSRNHPEVAAQLAQIGEPAVPALIEVLRLRRGMFEETAIEQTVSQILVRMGVGVIDQLLSRLNDENGQVRTGIIYTLRQFASANPTIIDQLKDLFLASLEDPEPGVRYEAVAFLGTFKIEAAFDGLVRALYDRQDYTIARIAARTLVLLGDKKAIIPLCQALEYELTRNPEKDWLVTLKVTGSVINALKQLEAVFEVPLQTLLIAISSRSNTDVNEWACYVLAERGDVSNIPIIQEALTHPDFRVKKAAARALAKLNELNNSLS